MIDAGEVASGVFGNVDLAALQVLKAAIIWCKGTSTGLPTGQMPGTSAALSNFNASAATRQTARSIQGSGNAYPSVMEVLGDGCGGSELHGAQAGERQVMRAPQSTR
jgi:TctA family transporter